MLRILILSILALPLLAQQEGQLSLGGMVINDKTGEPVHRALVRIVRLGAWADAQKGVRPAPLTRSAFTDSGGEFHFSGLPSGQYSVTSQKPGFTFSAPADKPIDLSASTEGVRVNLSPLGVITGKIVDQDG